MKENLKNNSKLMNNFGEENIEFLEKPFEKNETANQKVYRLVLGNSGKVNVKPNIKGMEKTADMLFR